MKISILTIGDEILIGQIVDTNSAWIGREAGKHGFQIDKCLSVGDDEGDIIMALDLLLKNADAVILTGGLGPTKDDITKKTLANYTGDELIFDDYAWGHISSTIRSFGREPTAAHKQQAFMPSKAELMPNKMGTAPGMLLRRGNKTIISLPGVPYEMQYLMNHEVFSRLKELYVPELFQEHFTLLTAGMGETMIAERIEDIEAEMEGRAKLAFLPGLGRVRLRVSATGKDPLKLKKEVQYWGAKIKDRLEDIIFGQGSIELPEAIGHLLLEKKLKLVTAESCTGGNIGHLITEIPGASQYYEGGFVSYSNQVKKDLLGVSQKTLNNRGAVSEECVVEMLNGVLKAIPSGDLGIAISGIAGPGGGSPEKPVGTIWIAVGNSQKASTHLLKAAKDRPKNIQYSSMRALNFLRKFVLENY